jgi:hypothetical protein
MQFPFHAAAHPQRRLRWLDCCHVTGFLPFSPRVETLQKPVPLSESCVSDGLVFFFFFFFFFIFYFIIYLRLPPICDCSTHMKREEIQVKPLPQPILKLFENSVVIMGQGLFQRQAKPGIYRFGIFRKNPRGYVAESGPRELLSFRRTVVPTATATLSAFPEFGGGSLIGLPKKAREERTNSSSCEAAVVS